MNCRVCVGLLAVAISALIAGPAELRAADLPAARVLVASADLTSTVVQLNEGKRVAAGNKSGAIHVWDIATGQEVQTLQGPAEEITALAVSPDGALLASAGRKATACIWDLKTFKLTHRIKLARIAGHASFTPDGRFVLFSMQADVIQVYDVQSGARIKEFPKLGYLACYTPDGRQIVSATPKQIHCRDATTYESIWNVSLARTRPVHLAFTPDGKFVLVSGGETGVILFDMSNGHEIRRVSFHNEPTRGLAVSPDGQWALTGTTEGNIYQWEIGTGRETQEYTGHTREVISIAISPDGLMFASDSDDGTLRTWRVGTPQGAAPPPGVATVIPSRAPAAPKPAPGTTSMPPTETLAPAVASNAIERPEYRDKPKQIEKNLTSITSMMVRIADDGTAIGQTSDIIASVPADSRGRHDGSAHIVGRTGSEMNIAMEEAVRAVKMRYPRWNGGDISISFGEKYSEHDGGSAGAAFGVLLLSALEGTNLDPKCALTGDITVDWKVRKVGAVGAKLRGATVDGCLYAGIPVENESALNDMALLSGDSSLWDIQTLTIATLQDAVALVRTDRAPALAEAMQLFAGLQPVLAKSGRAALKDPSNQSTLRRIVELAPNHLSASLLLAIAENRADTTLSAGASLYEISVIGYPYIGILSGRERVTRASLPASVTIGARRRIQKLRPIVNKDFQPILADLAAFVERAEAVANRLESEASLDEKRQAFFQHLEAMSENRNVLEKLVREGY